MNREAKPRYAFENAPRCSATSKRTGEDCRAPRMRGWNVCRFHGAKGGAPRGEGNGAYRHGMFTAEALEDHRRVGKLLRASRELLKDLVA